MEKGTVVNIMIIVVLLMSGSIQALEISNDHLSLVYDTERATLRVTAKESQKTFIDGTLSQREISTVKKSTVKDSIFGKGEVLELSYANGRSDCITLYKHVDFLYIQPMMTNKSSDLVNLKKVELLDTIINLNQSVDSLKALGTAGLTKVDEHPGSYMFLSVADPESRNGVVGAWLSSDRGSGIVFSGKENDKATLQAQIDYGRLNIKPGETVEGEIFILGYFADIRLGLEKYADLVAQYNEIKLLPQLDGYCTWYSRPHGRASDEERIIELSEFSAQKLKPYGFDFVQIDDYWQEGKRRNGPAKVFDRVDPNGPYKGGMKPVADKIVDMGLIAGIWWMPFAGDRQDPFFADKQDWFSKKADGTPYHTPWGGTALDMTNPTVRDYVRFLANRMANEWGYKYFKMDGMWMGTSSKQIYVNNGYNGEDDLGIQTVYNPDITPIEGYRASLKDIRESAGSDVFLLGCCASQNMRSFGGAFGTVDAMRIGPDNGANWKSLTRGPWHGTNRYFLHNRVWYNDPDPLYVRKSMPIEHAQLICSWIAISGQLSVSSEWYPELPPERLDLIQRTLPSHTLHARPVDLLENDIAKIWLLQDDRSGVQRNIVGLYNWSDQASDLIEYDLTKLGLDSKKTYVGFDYWNDRFIPPFSKILTTELPPAHCQVLSLRELKDYPVVVSSSRHITQGIVDIREEQWDPSKRILSGSSQLVANDPYELRMVVSTGNKSWKITSFKIINGKAKVLSSSQDGPMVRVKLQSEEGGGITWSAKFNRARIHSPVPIPVVGLKAAVELNRVTLTWNPVTECSFEITRNDTKTMRAMTNQLIDTNVTSGQQYQYSIRACGWEGVTSSPVDITVTLPEKLKRPPMPPAPAISITTLKPVKATTGWGGEIRINKSIENKPLTLDGKKYKDGIGVHAKSLLVYKIPAGHQRFVAYVGLDDEKKEDERSSVVFEVYGDVKEMGEPPVLLGRSPVLSYKTIRTWCFDIVLSDRHREVRLVVTDAGDGIAADHADWVNTGFLRE